MKSGFNEQPTATRHSATRLSDDAGDRLVSDVGPRIGRDDEVGLRRHIRLHFTRAQLRETLEHHSPDAVRIAATALGLVGTFGDSTALSAALHHDDYFVATTAERSLWTIWMRASKESCRTLLRAAIDAIEQENFKQAETLLDRILIRDPHFAEASNQRAIAHYLCERFELSIVACHRVLVLNPNHFGAVAGLGHNYFQLGQFQGAIAAYRRALAIHPRMEGIRQAMRRTREAAKAQPEQITPTSHQQSNTILAFPQATN